MTLFNIQENVPMRKYLSLRCGGNARYFAEINNVNELQEAQKFALSKGIPTFLLGQGTNILLSDSGYSGLILKLTGEFKSYQFEKKENSLIIYAKAGAILGSVVRKAAKEGFGGIHLLAGIPGSIGGATYMNAGAYGSELSQAVKQVKTMDSQGNLKTYSVEDCAFNYRSSIFQKNKEWILETILELPFTPEKNLIHEIEEAMKSRKEKQPLEIPNAGSAFKRPQNGFPGKFIEDAGLKGFRIGDAQVSEKHANFIVNLGNATSTEVAKVFKHVEEKVLEHSGVQLEREVIFLGDFNQ